MSRALQSESHRENIKYREEQTDSIPVDKHYLFELKRRYMLT